MVTVTLLNLVDRVLDSRQLGRLFTQTLGVSSSADEPGSKISPDHARLLDAAGRSSTLKPRRRSSRIILRARTFFASALTAAPRSS